MPERRAVFWLGLAVLVIVLDQATKYAATLGLALHEPVGILPGVNFTLVHNTGAAFSLLSEAGGWQRWFFAALAAGVSAVLTLWLLRLPRGQITLAAGLAFLLGGALGNLIDRLHLGYVIDFIDLYWRDWHWPAFNIADAAITVGVVLMLLDSLLQSRRARGAAAGDARASD